MKWPGPRGAAEGRPGWHIECSAMSRKHLGDTIDLHAGGVDLLFPHHENEIAQSEGCTGHPFSRHWYHSEFLLVDGRKMSKSLGNLYTLADLVSTRGSKPMAVRYALLSGHPRKQLNFSLDSLYAATEALNTLSHFYDALKTFAQKRGYTPSNRFVNVIDELREDLNIPAGLGTLFAAIKSPSPDTPGDLTGFEQAIRVLGLRLNTWVRLPDDDTAADLMANVVIPDAITALAQKRLAARLARDFKTADALRKELAAAGWSMLDGKDGYRLEPLKKA